jgi:HSP20 family molecular chaperone IbpA
MVAYYDTKQWDEHLRDLAKSFGIQEQFDLKQDVNFFLLRNKESHVISAGIPGVKKEEINIYVSSDNTLNISYSPKEKNIYTPSFEKKYILKDVDFSNLSAKYENGVIEISIPLKKQSVEKVKHFTVS